MLTFCHQHDHTVNRLVRWELDSLLTYPCHGQVWGDQNYSFYQQTTSMTQSTSYDEVCQQIHHQARCGGVRPIHSTTRSNRQPDVVRSGLLTLPTDPSPSQIWWGQVYSLCQWIHHPAKCGGSRLTHFANRSIRQPDVVGSDLLTLPTDPSDNQVWWGQVSVGVPSRGLQHDASTCSNNECRLFQDWLQLAPQRPPCL